jgi:hypothetical protein
MNEVTNRYAPPGVEVTAPPVMAAPYFAASATKFLLLSALTFTIYAIYWSYRNWYALLGGRRGAAFLRVFFSPITTFALFARLDRAAGAASVASFPAVPCAALYLAANVFAVLPSPWAVAAALLAFIPFLPANAVALRLNQALAPDAPDPAPWTTWNVVAAALGGLVFLMLLISLIIIVTLQ